MHNEWDPAAKSAKMRVLHNFGREDQVDKAAIERLAGSLCRLLDPARAAALREPGLSYQGSVAVRRAVAARPAVAAAGHRRDHDRPGSATRRDAAVERVLFALVANRALDPSSKLAAAHWVGRKAWIDGLPETTDDACYRAMDWLHQVKRPRSRRRSTARSRTCSTSRSTCCSSTPRAPISRWTRTTSRPPRGERGERLPDGDGERPPGSEARAGGFRAYGKSKDHRDDLPQVVIGMAVTRDGIPVRIWCWPGNTADSALIRQVKDDMRDWTLARIVWVADRGFTSAENRRYLRQGDHHYIIGEKLRSGSAEAQAALSRQGRYQDVTANLRVKEVRVSESERFVICFNPEAAERDAKVRDRMLAQLEELIKDSDQLSATKRAELRGVISTKPGLNRYLRDDARRAAPDRRGQGQGRGEPRRQVPAADQRPQAGGRGHRARLQAAPGSRARLARPQAGHRPAARSTTARKNAFAPTSSCAGSPFSSSGSPRPPPATTWRTITSELDLFTLGTFTGPAGTFRQTAELTKTQRDLLAKLKIAHPKKIIEATPASP